MDDLTAKVRSNLEGIAWTMASREQLEIPGWNEGDDPEFNEIVAACSYDSLVDFAASLGSESGVPPRIHDAAREEARMVARAELAWESLERSYEIGASVGAEHLETMIAAMPGDPPFHLVAAGACMARLFDFVASLLPLVEEEYRVERSLVSASPRGEAAILRSVRALLAGDPDGAARLPYELDRHHHALIVWDGDVDGVIAAIAEQIGCDSLAVSPYAGIAWGWFSPLEGTTSEQVVETCRTAGRVNGVRIAHARTREKGVEGFRAAHLKAREARRVAMRCGVEVADHETVALPALLMGDEEEVALFVSRELEPMRRAGARGELLIETLRAYFDASLNSVRAAGSLGVKDRTVAYRLRQVEDLIGATLESRRVELEAAIRLDRLLPRS